MIGKCNCGLEGRYQSIRGGIEVYSCSKYGPCPTYKDLENKIEELEGRLAELRQGSDDIESAYIIKLLNRIAELT